MSSHPSHPRNRQQTRTHKVQLAIGILVLLALGLWAARSGYHHFYPPHTEESVHHLYLEIETDKNLTLPEVLGYRNDTPEKYVIIQRGGIYFYTLSPGWNFTRQLDVSNNWWYPVELDVSSAGNISSFLTIDVSSRLLAPKTKETLNLTVHIPNENVLAGQYGGNLTVRLTPKKT